MKAESVSKELCSKVGDDFDNFLKGFWKAKGMVKGKTSLKYGTNFEIKVEAFGNDDVTKEIALEIQKKIAEYAQITFEDNSLELTYNKAKYGENHFSMVLKADAIELGKNGVNLRGKYAQEFAMSCWQYELTEDALGTEGIINGKKYFLAGIESRRNVLKIVTMTADGKHQIWNNERVITSFGGKYEPKVVVRIPVRNS